MIRVELKYCECCGGLLLRAVGNAGLIYCAPCGRAMSELPVGRPEEERRGRRRKLGDPAVPARQAPGPGAEGQGTNEAGALVARVLRVDCATARTA